MKAPLRRIKKEKETSPNRKIGWGALTPIVKKQKKIPYSRIKNGKTGIVLQFFSMIVAGCLKSLNTNKQF